MNKDNSGKNLPVYNAGKPWRYLKELQKEILDFLGLSEDTLNEFYKREFDQNKPKDSKSVINYLLLEGYKCKKFSFIVKLIKSYLKKPNDTFIELFVFNAIKNWTLNQKIFQFEDSLVKTLLSMDPPDDIPCEVLVSSLPFYTTVVTWPTPVEITFSNFKGKYDTAFFSFIHYSNDIKLGVFLFGPNSRTECWLTLKAGDTVKGRTKKFNVGSTNIFYEDTAPIFNLLLYLGSKNADIEEVKNKGFARNADNQQENHTYLVGYRSVSSRTKRYPFSSGSQKKELFKTRAVRAHFQRYWISSSHFLYEDCAPIANNVKRCLVYFKPPRIDGNWKQLTTVTILHRDQIRLLDS